MKFTAEFDSVNSADIAATAIRRKISQFSRVEVKDIADGGNLYNDDMLIFSNYNPNVASPTYSPLVFAADSLSSAVREDSLRHHPIIEVTCSRDDEKTVSAIIIGYGGRNITKA